MMTSNRIAVTGFALSLSKGRRRKSVARLLEPGTVLRRRYKIIAPVGQGGMGAVYRAEDLRLEGRICAVKEVRPDPDASPEALAQAQEQFHREASVLARLDHPNLPKVSDMFVEHRREYLVMDFVSGWDLRQLVEEKRRAGEFLSEDKVLKWVDQLCDALEYLHSQLSFVFQNFGRYEATIFDNIALGNPNELMNNHDRIEKVARLANIHDMIDRMPQGYDTMLGRTFGEYTLSGGQWQQIALARAFARESALLILDEPTSNLDPANISIINDILREEAKNRVIIIATHDLLQVSRLASRVLFLKDGVISEEGTPEHMEAITMFTENIFTGISKHQEGVSTIDIDKIKLKFTEQVEGRA